MRGRTLPPAPAARLQGTMALAWAPSNPLHPPEGKGALLPVSPHPNSFLFPDETLPRPLSASVDSQSKIPSPPWGNEVAGHCLPHKALSPARSLANHYSAPGCRGAAAGRLTGRAGYLPVGEVEVLVHVHPECGGLQTMQADDAVLGASDFDIVHREEPVTVGICLGGESGLRVTPQASGHLPASDSPRALRFHQVRGPRPWGTEVT